MKKTIRLIDLDCAHCAAKIENSVKKIDGVTDASVSFMSQKMVLEAPDAQFEDVLAKAKKLIHKIDVLRRLSESKRRNYIITTAKTPPSAI